ncbi:MAG: helix-turn-helix domain-containing protein, partial [Aequorivita sp.]|nr:helix-turn-helix domain-containing protein [Aequorivita sp.]
SNEKQLILNALKEAEFNKTKAAKLLNITRKTLYNKLEHYQIDL